MRPLDTWRGCGEPVDLGKARGGCTCGPNDPTRLRATNALARLNTERRTPVPDTPRRHRAREGAT